ncbi:MAG: ferredoxin [Armatimonadota bacterium]|nr:ferredoxin [Armatimonadota bacterium]
MKVTVDRDLCIGAGNCVAIAPAVFQLDADNKAVVAEDQDAPDDLLWDAAESCPTKAIILEDDETGEVVYP